MIQEPLVQQVRIESQALDHVTRALEGVLNWTVAGDGFVRKLSSVRFFADLYQRHVERLFALEEVDGYLDGVSRLNPELANQVDQLRREHELYRAKISESIVRISLASSDRVAEFEENCRHLHSTIHQVLEHLRRESELLVDSLNQDTGGEG